ncbi:MAG: hypothetical protein RL199_892 [Pseudomonadota bacterium]|jgi:hypothetical protein
MSDILPPCGLYRTTNDLGDVPAGRLVYFHNHGEPGPGVYLPERWEHNRARFAERGFTLPEPYEASARGLAPLPAEGFYRVVRPFHCCEKECTLFEAETLVQLGYDGAGEAILFVPELTPAGLTLPTRGSRVAVDRFSSLALVKVAEARTPPQASGPRTSRDMLH